MNIKKELNHFKAEGNPEIFIAQAGVHKSEWIASSLGESQEDAVSKMSSNRFDLLPVINKDGECKSYYRTKIWANFDDGQIEYFEIKPEDKLYYLTDIDDAIKRFAETGRKFFFLDDLTDIVGLVTISDLNCKQVFLYLYSLSSQFERTMANCIYSNEITDAMIQSILEGREDSKNTSEALIKYEEDKKEGIDYKLLEYLYLGDLSYVFKIYNLPEIYGINRKCWDATISKLIHTVRNTIAHPYKKLIKNDKSIRDLHEVITSMNYILEKLI